MAKGDWFRALQVPVLPVSAGAALVGSLYGHFDSSRPNDLVFVLVLASLVLIQTAANLQKGLVESADLSAEPARPRSAFVFDAGAISRTGIARRRAERLTFFLFVAGAGLGLAVVALTGDLLLLVLGALGALFAYSYSGPPFKLSYRGVGEVATFIAFGPLMVWGAYRAQASDLYPAYIASTSFLFVSREIFWLGLSFGALAAMISYARYFPAAAEDKLKGKRTPVVRLSPRSASWGFAAMVAVAAITMLAAFVQAGPGHGLGPAIYPPPARFAVERLLAVGLIAAVGAYAARGLASPLPEQTSKAVRATVLLQVAVAALVSAASLS